MTTIEIIVVVLSGIFLFILSGSMISSRLVVRTDIATEKNKNAGAYYYLPESIIRIRATAKAAVAYDSANRLMIGSSYVMEENFTVTTETIADTSNLLLLNYVSNIFMADEIKYTVNSKGLLEGLNLTTDDRTAGVISRVSDAPKTIFGASKSSATAEPVKGLVAREAPATVKIKEYTSDCIIRPSDTDAAGKTIEWTLPIVNEMGLEEQPQQLPAGFCVRLTAGIGPGTAISSLVPESARTKDGGFGGMLTRPLKNIWVAIESTQDSVSISPLLPLMITVVDVSDVIVIPVKRHAFIKRTNKIVIQDGMVLSNEIISPSSVEGFISIPIDILKAIISIPAQLIKFRFDNTKGLEQLEIAKLEYEKSIQARAKYEFTKGQELEEAKLNYEKSVQERIKYELKKEQDLERVKLDIKNSDISNKKEIASLQTALMQAEKAQIESKLELEELRKKVEKLGG